MASMPIIWRRIDGLTRYNLRCQPAMARYCGTLFSLGHGAVVIAIALGVSAVAGQWDVPDWFGTLGSLISIAFLVALGSLNLAAVLRAGPDEIVQPVGLKGACLVICDMHRTPFWWRWSVRSLPCRSTPCPGRFFRLDGNPLRRLGTCLVARGAVHARHAAYRRDHGLWIARLIARADQVALVASRVMGLVVSGISLLVAAFGAAKMLSPAIDAWSEGKELVFGFLLVALIVLSFIAALRLTRRPAAT